MTAELIRVFIADDHPIVRRGLEIVINSQPDMELVGQAADGNEALILIREMNPDVVVMDLRMPVKNGLAAIEELRKSGKDIPVLVLTSFPDDDQVISAIQLGASGVILKDTPPEQLVDAIRDVSQGKSALHPLVAHKLMKKVQESATVLPLDQLLTNREIDVLKCLAQGLSNREIAQELSVSTRTVTTHVRNIMNKLGLDNRTQAALYAVEHGIANK